MDIQRRALYNSLRMNWLLDSSIRAEDWQVEDYRSTSLDEIFKRLHEKDIFVDKISFCALSNNVDSPEEMTEALLEEMDVTDKERDQIYLLIFELWRRLVTEKPSLSIFCDELDHQIHLYDQNQIDNTEGLQDALGNIQMILEENIDQGVKPEQVFETIKFGCAHELETFLYDYISEQIENGNESYASELIDDFEECLEGDIWFDLLKARLLADSDPETAEEVIKKLIQKSTKEADIDFNLEMLSFLVKGGDQGDFIKMVKRTIPFLETEEDFQYLLDICGDYFRCLDLDEKEQEVHNMLKQRAQQDLESPVNPNHPHLKELLKILS